MRTWALLLCLMLLALRSWAAAWLPMPLPQANPHAPMPQATVQAPDAHAHPTHGMHGMHAAHAAQDLSPTRLDHACPAQAACQDAHASVHADGACTLCAMCHLAMALGPVVPPLLSMPPMAWPSDPPIPLARGSWLPLGHPPRS